MHALILTESTFRVLNFSLCSKDEKDEDEEKDEDDEDDEDEEEDDDDEDEVHLRLFTLASLDFSQFGNHYPVEY